MSPAFHRRNLRMTAFPRTKNQEKRQRQVLSAVVISKYTRQRHFSWKYTRFTPFAVEILFSPRQVDKMDATSVPYDVLDLAIHGIDVSQICRNTMKLLKNARRIIVVAGAGVSVAAGIPDFRSSAGLFSTLKADTKFKPSGKALFDASVYKVCLCSFQGLIFQSDVGTQSYNEMIQSLHTMTTEAVPTAFHSFLDKLSPRIARIYTQNIDSLENRFAALSTTVPLPLKAPWPKTIQLHGDLRYAVCSKCRWIGSLDPSQLSSTEEMGCMECRVADDVRQVVGKRCQGVGMIRPRVVLYNEPNPDAVPPTFKCELTLGCYWSRIECGYPV